MADNFEWVHYAVDGIMLAATAFFGWLGSRFVNRVDQHDADIKNMQLADKDLMTALERLRTHITENYASKPETRESLARVHNKIEEVGASVTDKIDALRRDIKQDIRDAVIARGNHK